MQEWICEILSGLRTNAKNSPNECRFPINGPFSMRVERADGRNNRWNYCEPNLLQIWLLHEFYGQNVCISCSLVLYVELWRDHKSSTISYDVRSSNADNGEIVMSRLILIILRFLVDGIWKVSRRKTAYLLSAGVCSRLYQLTGIPLQSAAPPTHAIGPIPIPVRLTEHVTQQPSKNHRRHNKRMDCSSILHMPLGRRPNDFHMSNSAIFRITLPVARLLCVSVCACDHNSAKKIYMHIFKVNNKFAVDSNL